MQPAIDEVALEMQTAVTNLRVESAMPPTTRHLIEDWLPSTKSPWKPSAKAAPWPATRWSTSSTSGGPAGRS